MINTKKCAILTMDNLQDFECYDQLLVDPLTQLGWQVDFISWKAKDICWDDYFVVIIRSTWDYQNDVSAFFKVLEKIEASHAILENSLEIVRWNLEKTYLKDLEAQGIQIVPTHWYDKFDTHSLTKAFNYWNCEEIIVKPVVSANADNTFRIHTQRQLNDQLQLFSVFENRAYMVQPFIQNILKEGEFSTFYFNGEYSHSILKTPKQGDFRVQEEHGGSLLKIEPEVTLKDISLKILQQINPTPLYARLDFVRNKNNEFCVMEVELIEPSLYFNMDPQAAERFARVLDEKYSK